MEIKKYLKSKRIKMIDFCQNNGISYGYFRHIANKRKVPSPELAFIIENATNGKVSRLELLYPKNDNSKRKAA